LANKGKKNPKWNERQSVFMGLLAFALCFFFFLLARLQAVTQIKIFIFFEEARNSQEN